MRTHAENWSNRMILGDSLLVMKSLAEKEALRGQVQMICRRPPANHPTPATACAVADPRCRAFSRRPWPSALVLSVEILFHSWHLKIGRQQRMQYALSGRGDCQILPTRNCRREVPVGGYGTGHVL